MVREPADCGECNRPEQFSWDSTNRVGDAPVIVCKTHTSRAPGWVYDLEDGVDVDWWSRVRPDPVRTDQSGMHGEGDDL